MRCGLCSWEFDEDSAQNSSCAKCLKLGDCRMIRCPRCGYEVPAEPNWIKNVLRKVKKT